MRAAALQYVRKVTGTRSPSKANEEHFQRAVDEITRATQAVLGAMEVRGPAHTREDELAKARARSAKRFGSPA